MCSLWDYVTALSSHLQIHPELLIGVGMLWLHSCIHTGQDSATIQSISTAFTSHLILDSLAAKYIVHSVMDNSMVRNIPTVRQQPFHMIKGSRWQKVFTCVYPSITDGRRNTRHSLEHTSTNDFKMVPFNLAISH